MKKFVKFEFSISDAPPVTIRMASVDRSAQIPQLDTSQTACDVSSRGASKESDNSIHNRIRKNANEDRGGVLIKTDALGRSHQDIGGKGSLIIRLCARHNRTTVCCSAAGQRLAENTGFCVNCKPSLGHLTKRYCSKFHFGCNTASYPVSV